MNKLSEKLDEGSLGKLFANWIFGTEITAQSARQLNIEIVKRYNAYTDQVKQIADQWVAIEQLMEACKRANGRLLELGGERNSPATLQIINVALAAAKKLQKGGLICTN